MTPTDFEDRFEMAAGDEDPCAIMGLQRLGQFRQIIMILRIAFEGNQRSIEIRCQNERRCCHGFSVSVFYFRPTFSASGRYCRV